MVVCAEPKQEIGNPEPAHAGRAGDRAPAGEDRRCRRENFRPGTHGKMGPGLRRVGSGKPGPGHAASFGFRPERTAARSGRLWGHRRIDGRLALRHGFPDRAPVRPNLSIGDSIASLHGVIGVLMALRHRDQTAAETGRTGGRRRPLRGGVQHDGERAARVRQHGEVRERTGSAISPGSFPQHLSHARPPACGHRRQRRFDIQAPDEHDRPARPCGGFLARRQRGKVQARR